MGLTDMYQRAEHSVGSSLEKGPTHVMLSLAEHDTLKDKERLLDENIILLKVINSMLDIPLTQNDSVMLQREIEKVLAKAKELTK